MAHIIALNELRKWAHLADNYLNNVKINCLLTEESENLYEKATGEDFPITEHLLFVDIDDYIDDLTADAEGGIKESDENSIRELLAKFNLVVLVHNVIKCKDLETCCNNLFREVLGNTKKYTDKDIEFGIELKLFALKYALHHEKEKDLRKQIDIYVHDRFHYPKNKPGNTEKLEQLLLKKRKRLLKGSIDINLDFIEGELNDKIIDLIKRFCPITEVPSATSSTKRSFSSYSDEAESSTSKRRNTIVDANRDEEERYQLSSDEESNTEDMVDDNNEDAHNGTEEQSLDGEHNKTEEHNPQTEDVDQNVHVEEHTIEQQDPHPRSTPERSSPTEAQSPPYTPNSEQNSGPKLKLRKPVEPWTPNEIEALEKGLSKHKGPFWVQIIEDSGGVLDNRTNVQCKDKARTELNKLKKRGLTDLGAWAYSKATLKNNKN